MKPEEAIKRLKGTLSLLHQTNVLFDDVNAYKDAMNVAVEALKRVGKADKYRWHDLRKDPNDLPEYEGETGSVIVFIDCGDSYDIIKYGCDVSCCNKPLRIGWFDEVDGGMIAEEIGIVAWKYVEPFEEE